MPSTASQPASAPASSATSATHPANTARGAAWPPTSRAANRALWTVQILLALLFLATGVMKLVMPLAALTAQMHMPGAFIRVLGVLELAGALGLVLPGLLHIRPRLTPLAAAGLVIIMAGATSATMETMGTLPAIGPLVVGILAGVVAYGRGLRLQTRL